MIETRRSAHQNHPKKQCCIRIALINQSKPISQMVEKKNEFLTETSLANKESKKINSE